MICQGCGCAEFDACVDAEGNACSWAEPGLCSFCFEEVHDVLEAHAGEAADPGPPPPLLYDAYGRPLR